MSPIKTSATTPVSLTPVRPPITITPSTVSNVALLPTTSTSSTPTHPTPLCESLLYLSFSIE
jgi:hypothetical protein